MTTDLRAPLVALGLIGLFVAVRVTALPLADTAPPTFGENTRKSVVVDSVRGEAVGSNAAIISRDPFRLGRRPMLPAYDPLRLGEQLAPPPSRPTLILVGVLDGRPPSAVIEGLPAVEGSRVVRVGDVIGAFKVKAIGNGSVVITGMDTTWVLKVREPWKN
jgi:hypothetical protein